MRKLMFVSALSLTGTFYAPSDVQAECRGVGPVRTVVRNVAERWRERLTRAGRVMLAVAERVSPTVEVQFIRDRPTVTFGYKFNPSNCANGRCTKE